MLLARQLRRMRLGTDAAPDLEAWRAFLVRTSATYGDIDRERYVYERSMKIASREMEEMAARVLEASERVAAERDRLAAILGSLGDGVLVVDTDGRVDSANPEAQDLLRMPADQLTGRALWETMHVTSLDEHGAAWTRDDFARMVDGAATDYRALVRVAMADGRSFVADVAARSLGAADDASVVVFRDVTDTWRAGREQDALERISRGIAQGTPTERVCAAVADELVTLFGARAAVVPDDVARPDETPDRVDALSRDPSRLRAEVTVDTVRWGDVVVDASAFDDRHGVGGHSLARFAELVGLAVSNDRARQSLMVMATTDPLTGLTNTRSFRERLDADLAAAAQGGWPMSLVMLDIDHFKQVNDVHGHGAGNEVLEELSRRLMRSARQRDCVARVGGEEFAWLMPQTDLAAGMEAAERTRLDIREAPFPPVGGLTASFGVAAWSPGLSAAELMEHADVALYWAKRHGRDSVFPYTDSLVTLSGAVAGADGGMTPEALLAALHTLEGPHASHALRVARLADLLASRLGWDPDARRRLLQAAVVHDLAAVGHDLLGGEGQGHPRSAWLAAHTRMGVAAAGAVLDEEQARWVRDSHRRWDVRHEAGEPTGTRDGACILAAADLWDSLVSDAPVGRGHDAGFAQRVIAGHAGGLLCPRVVDALPDVLSGPGSAPDPVSAGV